MARPRSRQAGLPAHRIGAVLPLEFYATVDSWSMSPTAHHPHIPTDACLLLPASSWAVRGMHAPSVPPVSGGLAADCGGFVAATRHGGQFSYTTEQYVRWLASWDEPPDWAALMDLPVEPQFAAGSADVAHRQRWTTATAREMVQRHADVPWQWVPTIQGQSVGEYVSHLWQMWPVIDELHTRYAVDSAGDYPFRLGIGSLCARTDPEEIAAIVTAVAAELPYSGLRLHLWGVKNRALTAGLPLGRVASVDSAAWNGRFGRDITKANDDRATTGLSQRAYGYRVALPRYVRRLAAALAPDVAGEDSSRGAASAGPGSAPGQTTGGPA